MGEVHETLDNTPIVETTKPAQPEVFAFCAGRIIGDYRTQHAQLAVGLWKTIQRRITRTPFNKIHSIEKEVQKVLEIIKNAPFVDSSSLRQMVQNYFDQVKTFLCHESSAAFKLSQAAQLEKLEVIDTRLKEYELEKKELEEKLSSVEANIYCLHNEKHDIEPILVVAQHELEPIYVLQSALESSLEELQTLE